MSGRCAPEYALIYSDAVQDKPSVEMEDDMYSFFVHCYHLKEWIKNDEALMAKPKVEDYINKHVSLRVCGDTFV